VRLSTLVGDDRIEARQANDDLLCAGGQPGGNLIDNRGDRHSKPACRESGHRQEDERPE
jgi:hypothetical protein